MSRPRTYTSGQIDRARNKARKGGWVLKKQSGTAYRAVRAKKSTSTRRSNSRRTRRPRMSNPDVVSRSATMNTRAMNAFSNSPTSLTFGGRSFTRHSASTTKREAVEEAGRFRSETGRTARVVKRKIGSRNFYLVYKGSSRRR